MEWLGGVIRKGVCVCGGGGGEQGEITLAGQKLNVHGKLVMHSFFNFDYSIKFITIF